MFDQLFTRSAARYRHWMGPLLEERLHYLIHLADEGLSPCTLRHTASFLLVVAARLRLAERPGEVIRRDEINRMAIRWAKRRPQTPRWKGGCNAKSHFRSYATKWLRFLGRLEQPSAPSSPYAATLAAYADYMLRERDFSPATIRGRCRLAEQFLLYLAAKNLSLAEVTIAQIDELFLQMMSRGDKARVSIRTYTDQLRAFLRYAEMQGWCRHGLACAVQGPRVFTQMSLPLGPSWEDVQRLLAATAGDQPADIRDRAILMLLSVYGLRAGEVRRLLLDNFDWERELVTVTCLKTRRTRVYPLCRRVGDAVLRYLKEVRPHTARREVFLTLKPPARPLDELWPVVARRLRPLGLSIPHCGPHALRHACATHLLAQGLSLKEIGDHLGHCDPDTTRIYAKVDLSGLRQVGDFDLGGLL